MKKWFLILLFILIILSSFSVIGINDGGVNLCGVPKPCGDNDDGICPSDFFAPGVDCYIRDEDCCNIAFVEGNLNKLKIGWSTSSTEFQPITKKIKEGTSIFLFVETTEKCVGKDAYFDIFLIEDNFLRDRELETRDTGIAGPYKVESSRIVAIPWVAYTDPGAVENGISKFKFRVKINPTAESEVLEVSLEGEEVTIGADSCNDLVDNDADGCADETVDCQDGVENKADFNECPVCVIDSSGISQCANCKLPGGGDWKCSVGECLDGRKNTICPEIPAGCPLTMPPKFVKCYEKTVPFPFYDNFNLALSIFSLIGYYCIDLFRKRKLR